MDKVLYSKHLELRLGLRGIPSALPRMVFESSSERYYDAQTWKMVALHETEYRGKIRGMVVVYEEAEGVVTLITIP